MLFQHGNPEKSTLSDTIEFTLHGNIARLNFTQIVLRREMVELEDYHIMGPEIFSRKTIKRLSHTCDKKKLVQSLDDHSVIGNTFALGYR
jgi:hypothetical protein